MNTNLTFNNAQFPANVLSFGDPAQPAIPPAGVHPVVAAQGKWASFHSPQAYDIGATVCFDSGFGDIPYCVRVKSCVPYQNGYFISGVIGE